MSDERPNEEAKELKFDLEVAPMESITKAEIDVQIATAHQFPRSLKQFYQRAEAMVTQDEETAESCIYKLTRFDKKTGEKKTIEGESIRMAEIVAACYGNMRSAVHVVGHTPTRVSVRAVAHDLETNNLIAVEKQAKTAYKDGTPYNEDMAIMIANATVSKALRDAIFRVVPKALIKPLKEKAKLVAVGTAETLKARRTKAMKWVESLKIDKARVFTVLGVVGEEDIGLEQLETLTGLRTAIRESDQTVDEAFPPLDEGRPIFQHPAKTEQEQEQKAEKPKTEPKKKAVEPKPEPAPEPAPQPVAQPELVQPQPEETKPVPPPAPAEPGKKQVELAAAVKEMGFTWEDWVGWASTALPGIKASPPKSWADVTDVVASLCVKNPKGVAAGIRGWKAKAG